MGENNDFFAGYSMGKTETGGTGFGGMFGEGLWAIIILAMLGFGNWGGGFGGFGGGGFANGALTRAELYDGFATQNIDAAIRGVQQGICDSTYALNSSLMSGFHGVDNAVCNLGYQTQQGFNTLGYAMKDCCCETQRLIERGFCDTNYNMATNTRDIIEANNANYRDLKDFLVGEKLAAKDARIAALEGQVGRAEQNGVIRAAIDAATAEIIRRTGNDCPIPAFWVQPPTPVATSNCGCC